MSDASQITRGSHTNRLATETVMALHGQLRRAGDEKTQAIELRLVQADGSVFVKRLAENENSVLVSQSVTYVGE